MKGGSNLCCVPFVTHRLFYVKYEAENDNTIEGSPGCESRLSLCISEILIEAVLPVGEGRNRKVIEVGLGARLRVEVRLMMWLCLFLRASQLS